MVERHAFVEVIGSSPILVLFYFLSILGKEIFKNVVKNLSLGDLELILCDWYEMWNNFQILSLKRKSLNGSVMVYGLLGNFEIMYQNRFIQKLKLR